MGRERGLDVRQRRVIKTLDDATDHVCDRVAGKWQDLAVLECLRGEEQSRRDAGTECLQQTNGSTTYRVTFNPPQPPASTGPVQRTSPFLSSSSAS